MKHPAVQRILEHQTVVLKLGRDVLRDGNTDDRSLRAIGLAAIECQDVFPELQQVIDQVPLDRIQQRYRIHSRLRQRRTAGRGRITSERACIVLSISAVPRSRSAVLPAVLPVRSPHRILRRRTPGRRLFPPPLLELPGLYPLAPHPRHLREEHVLLHPQPLGALLDIDRPRYLVRDDRYGIYDVPDQLRLPDGIAFDGGGEQVVFELNEIGLVLRQEVQNLLPRVGAGEGVGILPVRQQHHLDDHSLLEQHVDTAEGGLDASRVPVVEHGDIVRKTLDEPDLVRGQ